MPDMQVLPDSVACADAAQPFEWSRADGGVDAAWIHVAGTLDIATTPRLAQTLRESQTGARLVVLDLGGTPVG